MRIKALIIGGLLALGAMGTGSASAEGVTLCYEYHINIADTVVQDSGPEPVCTEVAPPA